MLIDLELKTDVAWLDDGTLIKIPSQKIQPSWGSWRDTFRLCVRNGAPSFYPNLIDFFYLYSLT